MRTFEPHHREQARDAIKRFNRRRRLGRVKLCSASRKHGQGPCGQIAMKNGKCAWHGGRTPSGNQYHVVQFPAGGTPKAERKLQRRMQDRQKADQARDERLAAMTPAERRKHERWQRTHKPGAGGQRARDRLLNRQSVDLVALMESDRPKTAEQEELTRAIDELKARGAHIAKGTSK